MEEPKYLSQVLDPSLFRKSVLNVVEAPCGSGKTTAAINRVASLASCPRKAIYLIDTVNGCERLSQEDKLTLPHVFYSSMIGDKHHFSSETINSVVVTTYAQFGVWVSQYPDFTENFEVIVCDEVHNLVQFSLFGDHGNCTEIAKDAICHAVIGGKTLVVGITATTDFLNLLKCPMFQVPIDVSQLRQYTQRNTIQYGSIREVLRQLSPTQHGGLYVATIKQIQEYEQIARSYGHNPIAIWSMFNTKHHMTEEQYNARSYVVEKEAVPPQYNLFIFNATAETALNIRSHMDFFIVHNSNPTHITQSRGRYRGDLDTLFIHDAENGVISVPPQFLGRRLFAEDRMLLREAVGMKNDKGRLIPLEDLKARLINCGYTITQGNRINNRDNIIIRKI